jgi:hypothetical protein
MVLLREIFIFTIQTPLGNVQNFFSPDIFFTACFTDYICLENPAVTLAWFF